jgi:hypothetical protein
VAGCCYYQV